MLCLERECYPPNRRARPPERGLVGAIIDHGLVGAIGRARVGESMLATAAASDVQSRPAVASLGNVMLLVGLLAVPGLVCFLGTTPDDPDQWWHLRAAQSICHERAWPSTDSLTWLGSGKPFPAYSWLAELEMLGLYQALGLRGLLLFSAALTTAIAAAVYRLASRQGAGLLAAGALSLAVVLGIKPLLAARPWLWTILLFVIELDLLLSARRSGRMGGLWWLPPLFCLWANVHIQFTVGLAWLALAAAEPWLARLLPPRWLAPECSRLPRRPMAILLGACIAATLVNPYHVGLYRTAIELLGQSGLWACIGELTAMPFRSLADWTVLGVTLGATFALGRARRVSLFPTLGLLAAIYFSFRSGRDVWLALVMGSAILAESIPWGRHSRIGLSRPAAAGVAVAMAALLVLFACRLDERDLDRKVAAGYPAGALAFLERQDRSEPVFTQFEWGGYLMFHQPGIRVNIDGRSIVHGEDRILRNADTLLGRCGWESDPELLAARWAVVPKKYALASLLARDARFQMAYDDPVTAVFRNRRGAPAGEGPRPY